MISFHSSVFTVAIIVFGQNNPKPIELPSLLSSRFDFIASYSMSEAESSQSHAFRAAAIDPPWIYGLDRMRRLYVLKLVELPAADKKESRHQLILVRTLEHFGDGSA